MHGYGGPLFVAVRQAAAPHFEVERQPVGQERFGEGLEVDAHQLFQVLVFVERAVLRQVDNAVEPPDSAQGFAEGIGDQVRAAPDTGGDGHVDVMYLAHSGRDAHRDVTVQFVQVVEVDAVVISKYRSIYSGSRSYRW